MKKPINYIAKKTWKGFVSVRSHILEKAVKQGKDLVITFNSQIMTIPYDYLKYAGQLHKHKFESKFNDKAYELYDFYFKPDNEEELKLF
uniref:Uncharacterized protein n=1 Tax=viral metagenome TaxID=1070528 RepID=A0A6H2A3H9_9ZZZZ